MGKLLKEVKIKKVIKKGDYLKYLTKPQKDKFLKGVSKLKGKKIVHINATAEGGGVAELLQSMIPYSESVGIESKWYVITPNIGGNFFETTNKFFNGLQGGEVKISKKDWKEYEDKSKLIAEELDKIDCDVLVIHDTQPLLAGYFSHVGKKKIFYNHVDTSNPFKDLWDRFFNIIDSYYRVISSNENFVNKDLERSKVKVFTPAIDPLSKKQEKVSKLKAREYLLEKGKIPNNVPLVVQVSRFDHWKNPIGLIKGFRLMKKIKPDLKDAQLALVGFNSAKDNPLAEIAFKEVSDFASPDKDIHLFYHPKGKDIVEFTMMAQNAADVVIQNSIKEGFGLTVSEAMWKEKAVVGGPASGVKKQIKNGSNGFIAKNPEELADRISFLLLNPKKRREIEIKARKTVKDKFLFSRFLLDFLKVCESCLK